MFDAIVLGSGRSGTSMVTGALARAGYFMGEALFSPRASNPKGFFEAPEVNGINEELLALAGAGDEAGLRAGQRWLAAPDAPVPAQAPAALHARMAALVQRRPFCFKDPRFGFTLPAWREHLGDARFVCVYRDPALTAASLVEEVRRAPYLAGVRFDAAAAFRLWQRQYEEILRHAQEGSWLFLHYSQVLTRDGLDRLAAFLDAEVDREFPDAKLERTEAPFEVPDAARELYARLNERAGHSPAPASGVRAHRRVAVIALVGDGDQALVPDVVEDVRGQRGVRAELVLVDRTTQGGLAVEGATVVRERGPSRGRAIRAALAATATDAIAFAAPGVRLLPSHLAAALGVLDQDAGVDAVAADLYLTDAHGQFVARRSPAMMGEAPGPFFEGALVLRRSALEGLDERAFVPSELALWARLVGTGRTRGTSEPGATIDRTRHDAAVERAREDAALVALGRAPVAGPPELTVSICTYQRRAVLEECLEAFARQLVPPGTFELVIVNDGSTDGTREWLDALELPVPARIVHQENGGLAAARNAGLVHARGRYVLFVNDDTIPFPDCVERHLAAHARAEEPTCVLGTFEQPAAALDNALMRHLEGSDEVFAYARLRAGERLDGMHFWTCNVSAPLADVRAVGAFDPTFRHYGCEDTDLGLRLEARGFTVLYEPRARALHRHVLSWDDLARRQRQVARAYVRLARKHPHVLRRWSNDTVDGAALADDVQREASAIAALSRAGAQLAALDVGAIAALGEPHASVAKDVSARLAEVLRVVNAAWWREGYLAGLTEHRLAGFHELVRARGEHPFVTDASAERPARHLRLLAFPRWDDAGHIGALLELVRPVADIATLVLRFDPAHDRDLDGGVARLSAAYAERLGDGVELDVVLESASFGRDEAMRLGRSVDGILATGDERSIELALAAAERLTDPAAVAAWRRRREAPEGTFPADAPSAFAPRIELSIIVPTCDRPRELAGLLERLAAQDLEPDRFEVIVVDDGSQPPAAATLIGAQRPYALTHLAQARSGPGAARNLALTRVRGDVVLFLNDDAVPFPDCARLHLEAHRRRATPCAVLGTFRLLRRHIVDSLAWHVETTTALFAQSVMHDGVLYDGQAFCTGNLSVPREVLLASRGFDESLPHAGGEDTEFGLRLAKEQGLRVLFDPRIRAGHDHAMELDSLLRRHQVLGWTAYRIQERHPDAAMVPGWPLSSADWRALEVAERAGATGHEALRERIAKTLAAERAKGRGPLLRAQLTESFRRLQDDAFRTGLLRARAGLPALDPRPSAALAIA